MTCYYILVFNHVFLKRMIFYFWPVPSNYSSFSFLSPFLFPSYPFFLPFNCSSSEKFWNCLQDVWLEWRWRSRHGGVWTGKLSWKVPLNTWIFNTFSHALELLLASILRCYLIFQIPNLSFFKIILTSNRWAFFVSFQSKC